MMHWPKAVEDARTLSETLVALLGEEGARQLADAFGGRRLSVPKTPGAAHPITVAIGQENAARLASAYHGHGIDVPMLPDRRRRIVELDAEGWSRSRIAREIGATERWVYRVLAEDRGEQASQPGLFG